MKISKEPVSAFAVYSEKFKQKKKTKPVVENGDKKINKTKKLGSDLKMRQMKEIGAILKHLADKSIANNEIVKTITETNSKIKLKHSKNASQEEKSPFNFTETVSSNTTDNFSISLNKPSKKATKTMKLSKESDDNKGMKTFDENDKSVSIEQNIQLGPYLNKSFENGNNGLSKHNEAKTGKPSKKFKAGKPNNLLYPKKTCNDRENSSSKVKKMKLKKPKDITSNNVSSLRNNGKKENLVLKKKSGFKTKLPEINEFMVKNKKDDSQERDYMDQKNSILAGESLFEWLIFPISLQDFMR
ncbi:hypothetical protein J6590_044073 [Homalodisca vitripennis]|nr:hypothetical protein J6590_044073 [Homalodisca vitripennis]